MVNVVGRARGWGREEEFKDRLTKSEVEGGAFGGDRWMDG